MKIVETFGPLLDCGDLEHGSFEVRGKIPEIAMVYAYCKINGAWVEDVTQLGGSPAQVVASSLIAGMKRRPV